MKKKTKRLEWCLTKREIDRDYPCRVEVLASMCAGKNKKVLKAFCQDLLVAPRQFYAQRNGIVYFTWCFGKEQHASAFHARFGGQRVMPEQQRGQRLSLSYDWHWRKKATPKAR